MTASQTFIGRTEILKDIEKFLLYPSLQSNKLRVTVLYGLGGIGKTQIAFKFADLFRQRYADGPCLLIPQLVISAHLNTDTNMFFGSMPNLKTASKGVLHVLLSCLILTAT